MEHEKQIIDLVTGNLEESKKKEILAKIKGDATLRKDYERIKNVWSLASYDQRLDDLTVEKSFVNFQNRTRKPKTLLIGQVFKYAAIMILFFSLGVVSNNYILPYFKSSSTIISELNSVHVPNGEKAELTLADGSRVWLNSGTTFRFPNSFDGEKREVAISGEAYFDVAKGKAPFIVSSEFGKIQVLGTSFNVRAYNDMLFQATLAEGKIQFKNKDEEIILAPGQQLIMSKNEGIIISQVDPALASSWKNGVISFVNEPLSIVMRKLERHFDIRVELDQKLSPIKFTGQVFDESLDEVMEYINKTKPIKYAYDKRKKTLKITAE
jgi:ferric-dicitrate binding protein FerR (iron transport regulator)